MNFFENQDKARRRTWLLVAYFFLAIALIIVAIIGVIYLIVVQSMTPAPSLREWLLEPYWIWITLGTLAVIGIGTVRTLFQLRGGGRAVAEIVGARRVRTNTENFEERRLLNLVEEMSIASGTPVPAVYVMDNEPVINAFVAGFRPTETVLVVTEGALKDLSRDEMQGVIGHEYSHILNGDMRINLRLMGLLAGLLLIGQIGRVMLRGGGRSSGRGKGGGQTALLGLALFLIGYIGLFFGTLIKASISRQREFLADASAVQFTRNPDGIAGALWRIKQKGSILYNSHADDLSHFCIAKSVASGFSRALATHPPVEDRINAINPLFLRQAMDRARGEQRRPPPEKTAAVEPAHAPSPHDRVAGVAAAAAVMASITAAGAAGKVSDRVGNVEAGHMEFARSLHAAIPAPVMKAVHDRGLARHVIYALLMTIIDADKRDEGRRLIREAEGEPVEKGSLELEAAVAALGAQARLPLVNLALPALKDLDWEARGRLLTTAEAVIEVDRRYSIFEFALLTILREHLAEEAERDVPVKHFRFSDVEAEIRIVLSVMARVGGGGDDNVRAAFQTVMRQFTAEPGEPADRKACTLPALSDALHELNMLSPMLKKSLIQACADCVTHDGDILPAEAELLQALAENLDCPMPPLTTSGTALI